MQQTTNYKFKKPELTDSPPDITVFNGNFDIIDEKLFAVIKAWEDFKANGGEIGGDITINTDSKIDLSQGNLRGEKGNVTLEANADNVILIKTKRSTDDREVTITIVNNDSEACVRPNGATGANKVDLGNPTVPFKDIFLGLPNIATDGHSRLVNGLIIQWGEITLTGSNSQSINEWPKFPISFPTTCINIVGTACSRDSNTNATSNRFYITRNNNSSFHYRLSGGDTNTSTTTVQWIALGY